MNRNGSFLIDILSILPKNNIVCHIQAPDIESENISSILSQTSDPALMLMEIDNNSIATITEEVCNNNIQGSIQYISFENNGNIIFEGYDGLEHNIFSKSFELPLWFIEKYEQYDMYAVSPNW